VTITDGSKASADQLVEFCRDKVAKWEVPKFIEILPELPKGPTGKVLKKVLQERYRSADNPLPWKVDVE